MKLVFYDMGEIIMGYENMSLVELKQLAKEKEIKNISKLRKEEIIIALQNLDDESDNINVNDNVLNDKSSELNEDEKIFTPKTPRPTDGSYVITNEDDHIVEGILEVLPDRLRLFKRR